MGRKVNKPSPAAEQLSGLVAWKYTKTMNMRDLARDDDYLSHLFIEKLGSLVSTSPLLVHKMDPLRRLPKTYTLDILDIVQRLIRARPSGSAVIKQAVNELLELPSVLYFIRDYEQSQINAFATHASRYLELYLPSGSIEIAQTSRYSRITGKNELCILATRPMQPGFLIVELKGSMADLTEEEDRELKRAGSRSCGGVRRDFSVIHSKQLKKNHLFLGPARFVNHDCDNNCELFRNGRYITFRAIKPIAVGQELTAHYGEGYFGKNNRHCLCETCERRGKGGYAPQSEDEMPSSQSNDESDIDNESDSDSTSVASEELQKGNEEVNLNERRTRRGVYLVLPEQQDDSGESDEDGDENDSQPATKARAESVATAALTEVSEASVMPFPSSKDIIDLAESSLGVSLIVKPKRGRPPKVLSSKSSTSSNDRPPFKSVITTRGQKAREASMSSSMSQLQTPPLSAGSSPTRTSTSGSVSSGPSLRPRKSEPVSISTPPSGPRPRGRPRKHPLPEGSTSFTVVKVEEKPAENVTARGRPSLTLKAKAKTASTAAAAAAAVATERVASEQKQVPLDPTCITCSNPLSMEAAEGSRKGKFKRVREECSRCKRHYLIYCAPWPQRNPTPGSRLSSTRENTPLELGHKVTHATISSVDQKLKAARLAQLKRSREKENEAELERAKLAKRQKVSVSPTRTQKGSGRRTRIPSMTVRERDGPEVKIENADDVPLHGPIDRSWLKRGQKRGAESESNGSVSSSRKRGRPSVAEEASEAAPFNEDGDDRRDKTFWPALPPLPPPGVGIKRTGLLNMRPNPMLVSRWRVSPLRPTQSSDSTPTLVDDDTDETTSDEHPATPENNNSHGSTPEAVESTESRSRLSQDTCNAPPTSDEDEDKDDNEDGFRVPKKLMVSTLKGLGLISKPSPLALSKRIWAPPALIADPDDEDLNHPAVSELTTPKPKRRKHASEASPKQSGDDDDREPSSDLSVWVPEARVKKSIFDDFDASSGEEDVIIPSRMDPSLYRLQKNATFSTTASAPKSPHGSPACSNDEKPCNGVFLPSYLSPKTSFAPKTLDKLNLPALGPLHSQFLKSAQGTVASPSFVDAGWESDFSV